MCNHCNIIFLSYLNFLLNCFQLITWWYINLDHWEHLTVFNLASQLLAREAAPSRILAQTFQFFHIGWHLFWRSLLGIQLLPLLLPKFLGWVNRCGSTPVMWVLRVSVARAMVWLLAEAGNLAGLTQLWLVGLLGVLLEGGTRATSIPLLHKSRRRLIVVIALCRSRWDVLLPLVLMEARRVQHHVSCRWHLTRWYVQSTHLLLKLLEWWDPLLWSVFRRNRNRSGGNIAVIKHLGLVQNRLARRVQQKLFLGLDAIIYSRVGRRAKVLILSESLRWDRNTILWAVIIGLDSNFFRCFADVNGRIRWVAAWRLNHFTAVDWLL